MPPQEGDEAFASSLTAQAPERLKHGQVGFPCPVVPHTARAQSIGPRWPRRGAGRLPPAQSCPPMRTYTRLRLAGGAVYMSARGGKTALVEAFLHHAAASGGLWIGRGQCVELRGRGSLLARA